MQKLFGISTKEFLAAIYGDHRAIQKIADMGRLGEVAKANLEPALKAAKTAIEATGDINKALAELTKQTQKSGSQTMGAIYDASLAEKKFHNELQERQMQQGVNVSQETGRHLRQTNLIQVRGAVADLMAVTKYQSDLYREQQKPHAAQHQADLEYEKAVSSALWSAGSDAQIQAIPKKDYQGNARRGGGRGIWKAFSDWAGI
jgi:hypothetical protein